MVVIAGGVCLVNPVIAHKKGRRTTISSSGTFMRAFVARFMFRSWGHPEGSGAWAAEIRLPYSRPPSPACALSGWRCWPSRGCSGLCRRPASSHEGPSCALRAWNGWRWRCHLLGTTARRCWTFLPVLAASWSASDAARRGGGAPLGSSASSATAGAGRRCGAGARPGPRRRPGGRRRVGPHGSRLRRRLWRPARRPPQCWRAPRRPSPGPRRSASAHARDVLRRYGAAPDLLEDARRLVADLTDAGARATSRRRAAVRRAAAGRRAARRARERAAAGAAGALRV